jgi:hypothetical protein
MICRKGHETEDGRRADGECPVCHYNSWKPAARRAGKRREYLRNKQAYIDKAKRWQMNNVEKKRAINRSWYRRNTGVSFWVQQVKESL